ncbi:hypothetical protein CCR75_006356 [Bremia lactucae]|uniref:SAC3/GANP/THP3 conserved domain-containing protein n=1 Tax=Bremia lactucae TaxID=4779 RepID=A0A976IMF0_BRELC|nr:hypothetical protein CCR75_006356 [Bremia lactucae]
METNPRSASLAAKQAAASAAARFAGYATFYASNTSSLHPNSNSTTVNSSVGMPPPRAAMYSGPRGPPPPRLPPLTHGFARPPPIPPQFALNARGPPHMRPPPRPATSQWQWSTGKSVQAPASVTAVGSAPPIKFNIHPLGRGMLPRSLNPPSGPFAVSTPAASTPAPASIGSNAKWPDSLHDYVKRAFARCKGAADQKITQNSLKELITNAIMTSSLWTTNWTAKPLPVLVGDLPAAGLPTQLNGQHLEGTALATTLLRPKKKAKKRPCNNSESGLVDLERKHQRRQRFQVSLQELHSFVTPEVDPKSLQVLTLDGDLDLAAMVIKGTSQTVEKEYLRLTSPPHPSTVRPESVLHQALALVQSKWKSGDHDYVYACSQLKSIRQDCTVQHIQNDFTVLVYESHARIALESGDINEFNQCQTQLHELYEKLDRGDVIEFLAYRILYCVYVSLQAKKNDSNSGQLGMYNVLAMVTPTRRVDPVIVHALGVRHAVAMNDYHGFFQLYVDAPNMAGYLMDVMVSTIRLNALRAMCKAYRPSLPVQFIRRELKLEGKTGNAFLRQSGLVFVKGDTTRVDTKASNVVRVLSNASSLI